MSFFSDLWKGIRKLSNFLGLGIPNKIDEWLQPDLPPKEALKVQREGSNKNVPVVYGNQKVGGIVVHKWVSDADGGAKNEFLHLIVIWSMGEIDGIEQVYFNDVKDTDDQWTKNGQRMWDRWDALGASDQAAIPEAVADIPNWTTSHRGRGVAHSYFRIRLDEEQSVWRGEPQITAAIRGLKVFDTRTGVTAYSSNPAMCLRDYLTNPIYGKGLSEARLNIPSFEAVADFCDEGTTITETTTEYVDISGGEPGVAPIPQTTTTTYTIPRFSCNLILDTGTGIFDNVKEIKQTFRGGLPQGNGVIRCTLETDGDPIAFFDEDNTVGSVNYSSGKKSDRYNRVVVKFPNAKKDFETDEVSWPPKDSQTYIDWLADDNGIELEQNFDFNGINNKGEALQMAEVIAKRSRVNANIAFTAQPVGLLIEPSDIIAFSNVTMGWDEKPFRVESITPNEDGTVDIAAIEHNNTIYPWTGAEFDETIGGTWLGDPNNIPAVTGLSLTQDPTLVETGKLVWDYDLNAFVRRYRVVVIDSIGDTVFDVDVLGRSWTVPLLDVGSYTIKVYAISTVGAQSPESAIAFTLSEPVAPTSLSVTARDWELEVAPQLAGIGLGTVFEFDIVAGDGTGHTPSSKGRATTFTFTGLLPDTLYTVYARSVNAYGVSAWTSEQATTTNTGAQVEPYLDTIRDELDAVELIVDDFGTWSPARDVSELVTTAFNDSERQQDSRATLEFAQDAGLTADNALQVVNAVRGEIDDPVTGLDATFSLAQQAEVTADGNASSITTILSGVTGETDDAAALLALESYLNNEGGLAARAFFGTDVNDRVTGIVVGDDGNLRQILFTADSVGFVDGNSTLKVYYDLANSRYVFDGHIVAQTGTFSGELNAATMNGGSINIGSGTFTVDSNGNMVAQSANIEGSLISDSGTGARVDVGDDGTYLLWMGDGAKTDANGTMWVKKNGTGFISGNWFEGEIIETRYGSASGGTPQTAVAVGHNSAGNTVELSGSVNGTASATGDFSGDARTLTVTFKRDATTITTRTVTSYGLYTSDFNTTRWSFSLSFSVQDTGALANTTYDYSVGVTVDVGSAVVQADFKTFENKLG